MASKEARAAKLVTTAKGCIESKDVAEHIAGERGRPVVYWVGMHCDEAPTVRAKLADAVIVTFRLGTTTQRPEW